MARLRSWLPWGILFHIATLFVIAWWIEDCFLYYIDWSQFTLLRGVETILAAAHINEFLAFFSRFIADLARGFATLIGEACSLIQSFYVALPESWRAHGALRFIAWCGATIVATFNSAAAYDCWRGLKWFLAKLLKVLIALNGGFWIHNSMRRLSLGLGNVISYPARFYSDRTEDTQAADFPPVAESDPDEVAPPRTNRDGRTRRREYVQFFQGHIERIGIILAGGGAKGAYQAGALKAIHEFLRDYNALHKVKMIAGTSIGAWNAMFWIGDMIDSEDDQQSGLERWWKHLRYRSLVEFPWLYIPFWSGSLLRSTPWRESFQRLFRGKLDAAFSDTAPTHFYLTRTDLNEVALKYATNWSGIGDRLDKLAKDKDDDYRFFEVIGAGERALEQTADAVFASLNLAPLFPYSKIGDALFEDGGVVENIPFRFGAPIEDCDLLFVLPLDTTFQEHDVPKQTLIKRIQRVAEVRRGVLEAHALKTADTINRFAQRIERLDFGVTTMANATPPEGVAAEALGGVREEIAEFNTEYKMLYIFTVCPSGKLELGTFDFWKRRAIQDAFDLMYLQTKRELQTGCSRTSNPRIRMWSLSMPRCPITTRCPNRRTSAHPICSRCTSAAGGLKSSSQLVLTNCGSTLQSRGQELRCQEKGDHVPQYHYTAVFEPAPEGGFTVTVPALPGLVTEGDTIEEAREMVKDAIRGYLESWVKHGEEIPIEPSPASIERVAVNMD